MMEIRNLTDIESLIANQVEENINLDYKSAKSLDASSEKKTEISKDITAFANANGGTIIYGVKEFDEKEKRHLPERIDPIKRKDFSKERLEQIINSIITPRINNIEIIPVELNDTDVLYIINIPKSDTAHQATDKRYYKRYNFEVQSMYDHEIRDVMNRNKYPKIELEFIIEHNTYERKNNSFIPQIPTISGKREAEKPIIDTSNRLFVYGKNTGQIMANYVNCNIEISADILDTEEYQYSESYNKYGIELKKIYCDNTVREIKEVVRVMYDSYNKYWPARYDPILPGTRSLLKEIILRDDLDLDNFNSIMFCSIHADNAEKNTVDVHTAEIKIKRKNQLGGA